MTATTKGRRFRPSEIEPTWQARWATDRLFEVDVEGVAGDRKFYNLVELALLHSL